MAVSGVILTVWRGLFQSVSALEILRSQIGRKEISKKLKKREGDCCVKSRRMAEPLVTTVGIDTADTDRSPAPGTAVGLRSQRSLEALRRRISGLISGSGTQVQPYGSVRHSNALH